MTIYSYFSLQSYMFLFIYNTVVLANRAQLFKTNNIVS